ncbi:hypothetical protein [Paenibacillus sp. CAA11]|uniref:hypothetical protein n=1 Tax=Paenibacillus sp. CAA11 TaxID=1532905 RepID=UPI00131EE602|nr:hypothetical protein [Paenibacillus sp. CAA11]
MQSKLLKITLPTILLLSLALAGCSSNSSSPSESAPPSSNTGANAAETTNPPANTGTQDTSAVDNNTASPNETTTTPPSEGTNTSSSSDQSSTTSPAAVIQKVQSQLKMKQALLPREFPLEKGQYLGATIQNNEADAYKVVFYQTDQPVPVNDASLAQKNTPVLATMEAKTYSDPKKIANLFPDYGEGADHVDLGHGIKGTADAGAGNRYLNWSEGRWNLLIHSLGEDNMDNPDIAKKMVDYLETHTLPIPKDKGQVNVDYKLGGKDVEVTVSWQDGSVVYQLTTSQVPNNALMMATSMK